MPLADVLGPATDLALTALGCRSWPLGGGARIARAARLLDEGAPDYTALLTARAGGRNAQGALAETLEAVRAHGVDGFYRGPVAEAIEGAVATRGDGVDRDNLAGYAGGREGASHRDPRGARLDGHPAAVAGGARPPGA